jgi:hypothetical protein
MIMLWEQLIGDATMTGSHFPPRRAFTATGKFTSARSIACGISAEGSVATQAQQPDAPRNVEAQFFVSRFHAPKLRLGETHVPERFSTRTRKNASGCGAHPLCTLLVAFGH